MTSNKLIHELSGILEPVKIDRPPLVRALQWASISIVLFLGFLFVHRLSYFEPLEFFRINRIAESIFLFLIVIFSALSAFFSAVPGKKHLFFTAAGVLAFAALITAVSVKVIFASAYIAIPAVLISSYCLQEVVISGIFSGGIYLYFQKKGLPVNEGLSTVMALLSGTASGALILSLFCEKSDIFHDIFCHYLPIPVILLVGYFAGSLYLGRQNRNRPVVLPE